LTRRDGSKSIMHTSRSGATRCGRISAATLTRYACNALLAMRYAWRRIVAPAIDRRRDQFV
jgi:hypothetical protein